jgi:drug/metabolite transporter (DMT)-like permease
MQSVAVKFFNKRNVSENPMVFNSIRVLSALILFIFYTLITENITFHVPTVICGVIYGISLSISMYFGYRALNLGPLALTGMLVSFSIIMPLIWGVLVRDESLNLIKVFAFVFLVVSMVSVNADKLQNGTKKQDGYLKWLLLVLFTFLSNGVCSIVQLEYANAYPSALNGEFMVY